MNMADILVFQKLVILALFMNFPKHHLLIQSILKEHSFNFLDMR